MKAPSGLASRVAGAAGPSSGGAAVKRKGQSSSAATTELRGEAGGGGQAEARFPKMVMVSQYTPFASELVLPLAHTSLSFHPFPPALLPGCLQSHVPGRLPG
jgi:hypothetical protein